MTLETEKTYPGKPGSDMAVVCDERIYSFYDCPDLRALEPEHTYALQVKELHGSESRSSFRFFETFLDLSEASWLEIVRSAAEHGQVLWAIVVDSNVLTETGGVLVIRSRLGTSKKRLQFTYNNSAGTLEVISL